MEISSNENNVDVPNNNPRILTRLYLALRHFDISQLYRKQSTEITDQRLSKVLTLVDLIAYGISATVGAGIFVTTGIATLTTGPSVIISYLFAAITSLLAAFCYGEFSARIPVSGSAYTFGYVSLGEFVAWIIAWCVTLEYGVSVSACARSFSGALIQALENFGVHMPLWVHGYPLSIFSFSPLSMTVIVACTIVLLLGAKESTTLNLLIMMFNVGIILFLIFLGSGFVDPANWTPFAPNGNQKIFVAAGTVFFAYIGFDNITTLSGEAKNPRRDVPIGIVGTLICATVLYIGAVTVFTGMIPLHSIDKHAPLAAAFNYVGAPLGAHVIAIGSVTTLVATTLTTLMGQPRIFYRMALDGLLFQPLLILNRRKVPWIATICTSVLSGSLAVLVDIDILTDMISIGTLMAFTIVCAGVIALRFKSDDQEIADTYGRWKSIEKHARVIHGFVIYLIFLWMALSSVFSLMYRNEISFSFCLIPLIIVGLPIFAALQILEPKSIPDNFSCPLVPLIPLLGMLINIFLISQKSIEGAKFFGIWLALGILIYMFYGHWNSKIRIKKNDRSKCALKRLDSLDSNKD